jgi:hypothetical protein
MTYDLYLKEFEGKAGDLVWDRSVYRFQVVGSSTFHKPSDKITQVKEDFVVVSKSDRTLSIPMHLFVVEAF